MKESERSVAVVKDRVGSYRHDTSCCVPTVPRPSETKNSESDTPTRWETKRDRYDGPDPRDDEAGNREREEYHKPGQKRSHLPHDVTDYL